MTQPINKKSQAKPTAKTAVKPQSKPQTKPAPKKKPLFSFGKKNKNLSAQNSIRYREMGSDGICRVDERFYSKTIRFLDINYQLAQKDDKTAIFENWCDFLNYFDSSIQFQLSFINL